MKQKSDSKKWYVVWAATTGELNDYLAEGFEPYAVVFVPGTGAIHFLRILK